MAFTLYLPPFTNDVSLVPSDFLEQLRVDINRAVDGNAGGTYGAAFTWQGLHTHTGQIKLSGSGAGILNRMGTIADSDATVDVSTDIYIASAGVTADRTLTLRHSTAPVPTIGQAIRFANHILTAAGTKDWIFKREDATELGRLQFQAAENDGLGFISFIFTASGWEGFEMGGSGNFTNH